MSGRTFTREFKLDVCRQIAAGEKRVSQVCREHELADTLLLRWRREYQRRGERAFTPKDASELPEPQMLQQRVAELERLCGQLSLENALLKKAFEQVQQARQLQQDQDRQRALSTISGPSGPASPSGNGKR